MPTSEPAPGRSSLRSPPKHSTSQLIASRLTSVTRNARSPSPPEEASVPTSGAAAVQAAAKKFHRKHGDSPNNGAKAKATGFAPRGGRKKSRHAFGAHFCQARVSTVTGEARIDRMHSVYAAGRIINPRTARSQLIGGTTMGISAALFEEAYLDPRYEHVVNSDFAGYHIAAHADIHDIEAVWIDEFDPWYGTTGAKGIGELGIVGVPAAISNAIYNAASIRLRDMPFTPDKVLEALESHRSP